MIAGQNNLRYNDHRAKAAYPLFSEGLTLQTKGRRACQWLHILSCFSFVYSLLPLLVCYIRFLRIKIAAITANSGGLPL